jgi:CheY-like chemotaxis protein
MDKPGTLLLNNINTILIVSDTPGFLERNKRLLAGAGVRILMATSAKQALKIHYKERVNLIIAKLDMPEMGGDMLCSLVRQRDGLRKVSVILVCNDKPGEVAAASQCGANAWFARPVNPVQLRQTVARLLAISPRRSYRTVIRANIHGLKGSLAFTGISHNISASGVLIESDMLLLENDLIKSKFVFPGSVLIAAECKVVRTVRMQGGKYNYGVEFSRIDPDYQKAIEKYVANGD